MNKTLNKHNITEVINEYNNNVKGMILPILSSDPLIRLKSLKRNKINTGPYPNVSEFEAANRILTDLIMLNGVSVLLSDPRFPFTEYMVEYGHGNSQDHDILSKCDNLEFHGECFNVSKSFYSAKKYSALKKLRSNPASFNVILVNDDAVGSNYTAKLKNNEFIISVKI